MEMVQEAKKLEVSGEQRLRMSLFIRSRLLARELGVVIVAMNFITGEALIHFTPDDAPVVASLAGA